MTVIISFCVLPAAWGEDADVGSQARKERVQRSKDAWAYFRSKCDKFAGEKIYKTVNGVDGIFLEEPRKRPRESELESQYWMGDVYGLILYPPVEISRYLSYLNENSFPTKMLTNRPGFKYVETPGSRADHYFLYRRNSDGEGFARAVSTVRSSRYSVKRYDISTKEDRSYWVAGSRLVVYDDNEKQILGERIGYVFEAGFGATSGGRRPWLMAQDNACPPIGRNLPIDRLFVEKVLRPVARGNNDGK